MPIAEPPEPWRSFLAEVDALLQETVELHLCAGFVVTQHYGVARTTSDVDFLGVVPNIRSELVRIAGKGSPLHRKHRIDLDPVTVATPPENYEERLVPIFDGAWTHLKVYALEAHDLALSKLERNIDRDRDDVRHLAHSGHIQPHILRDRYRSELRPSLSNESRHDATLALWLAACW